MRRYGSLSVAACFLLAGRAAAVDLATIDRSVRTEPPYQSKIPQYCLLVFGPQAKTRVWMVLDGDVLYVDRNGNGDLTDPGERVISQQARLRPADRSVGEGYSFDLQCFKAGAEPILSCDPEVVWLHVGPMQEKSFSVTVATKTGYVQQALFVRFGDRPQDAPIFQIDGPRHFALNNKLGPHVFRPGETSELVVELTSPALKARMRTEHSLIPAELHPVAELEFPPAKAGGDPIRVRVELKERC